MVQIHNVSKSFKHKQVLENVNLKLDQGIYAKRTI